MEIQQTEKKQLLELRNREVLSVDAVENVERFSPSEVLLKTGLGRLRIGGSDLKLEDLSRQSGGILLKGKVDEISFADIKEKRSIIKDMFK